MVVVAAAAVVSSDCAECCTVLMAVQDAARRARARCPSGILDATARYAWVSAGRDGGMVALIEPQDDCCFRWGVTP